MIISVLASFVLPKFSLSKKSAQFSKVRADVAAIRMGILLYKNKSMMNGTGSYPKTLDNAKHNEDGEELFGNGVLAYPILSAEKPFSWGKNQDNDYRLWLGVNPDGEDLAYVDFYYEDGNGTFTCDTKYDANCLKVIQ